MNADSFARAHGAAWDELEALARTRRLDAAGVRMLAARYRSAAADLAYARRAFPDAAYLDRLDELVGTARLRVYRSAPSQYVEIYPFLRGVPGAAIIGAFIWFFARGFWRSVRYRPIFLAIAAVLFFGPFIGSAVWAQYEPAKARGLAPDGVESVVERPSADFRLTLDQKAAASAQIYTNNIRIALFEWFGGLFAGVVTAVVLLYQGIALGATFGLTIKAGNGDVLWGFVLPHGFLELSCLVVVGAAGLRWGWTLIDPGYQTRARAFAEEGKRAVQVALGVAAALFFCGIVEGVVSTSGIGIGPGLAVGIGIGALFWGCIILLGRAQDPVDTRFPATTVLTG